MGRRDRALPLHGNQITEWKTQLPEGRWERFPSPWEQDLHL